MATKLENRRQNPAYKAWYDAGQATTDDFEAAKKAGLKKQSYEWHKFVNAKKQGRRDALGGKPSPWLDRQPDGTERLAGGGGGGNGLGVPRTMQHGGQGASGLTKPAVPKASYDPSSALSAMEKSSVPEANLRGYVADPDVKRGLMVPRTRETAPTVGGMDTAGDTRLPGVSGRLDQLLRSDSPYLERARTRGLQHANRRGLANSSIAAGASETAAIDAALPIATGDAEIAARERTMRHTEFMQARDHRVQQLMQLRGFDFTAAENYADRELRDVMQQRDHRVQQLMQLRGLTHEAAQRQADRELSLLIQERGFGEAARDRAWRGGQAELDRDITRQQLEVGDRQTDERLQASREESSRNAVQNINQNYQQNRLQVMQNPDLSQEDRDRILGDLARQRDVALNMSRRVGNYRVTWPSDDPENDGAIIGG